MSLVSLYNDLRIERVDRGTCKYCGHGFRWKWSTYHKKNKPYELNEERYHTCKNGGAPITVVKLAPEEIESLYGKPQNQKKKSF